MLSTEAKIETISRTEYEDFSELKIVTTREIKYITCLPNGEVRVDTFARTNPRSCANCRTLPKLIGRPCSECADGSKWRRKTWLQRMFS